MHGLALSPAVPTGEKRGRGKGEREGERGDVAVDRWGRAVNGKGVVMRRPAGAAACWRLFSVSFKFESDSNLNPHK
jgi:hypothetical protein